VVAVFEALKGILILIAGFGLLSLIHRDLQEIAEEIVRHLHVNPARHYPRVFIEAASHVNDSKLKFMAAMAFLYSSVRFVEAYGLWHLRAWAEWFAIISGSLYLPLEIYGLFEHATWIKATVLLVNAGIVIYMVYVRWTEREAHVKTVGSPPARI